MSNRKTRNPLEIFVSMGLGGVLILYPLGAFICWSFNPDNWYPLIRGTLAIFWIYLTASATTDKIKSEQRKARK